MADSRFSCSLCAKTFVQKRNLNRHLLTHQSANHSCQKCGRLFHRNDVLAKHQEKCLVEIEDEKTCDMCKTTFTQKCHMTRHKKMCVIKQQQCKMKKSSEAFKEKLKVGYMIEKVLRKCPDTMEEALDASDKECLKLYQSSCEESIEMKEVVLKPWQENVIRLIDNPSERFIFWIIGEKGNEGKTFIQKYIHKLFGSRRVLKSEVNSKKADIAYVLSQETLTCKDIFLFNLLRSDLDVAYGLLENLKDGYLISSKYRSKPLKIKTPNTVLVFSNSLPNKTQLSADRWKIYEIHDNELRQNLLT